MSILAWDCNKNAPVLAIESPFFGVITSISSIPIVIPLYPPFLKLIYHDNPPRTTQNHMAFYHGISRIRWWVPTSPTSPGPPSKRRRKHRRNSPRPTSASAEDSPSKNGRFCVFCFMMFHGNILSIDILFKIIYYYVSMFFLFMFFLAVSWENFVMTYKL